MFSGLNIHEKFGEQAENFILLTTSLTSTMQPEIKMNHLDFLQCKKC